MTAENRGAPWPIKLGATSNGRGWYPTTHLLELVGQNLRTLLTVPIGYLIREEKFGTRLQETLEEPNNEALRFLIRKYVTDAIQRHEPRVEVINVVAVREYSKVLVRVTYNLKEQNTEQTLSLAYETT